MQNSMYLANCFGPLAFSRAAASKIQYLVKGIQKQIIFCGARQRTIVCICLGTIACSRAAARKIQCLVKGIQKQIIFVGLDNEKLSVCSLTLLTAQGPQLGKIQYLVKGIRKQITFVRARERTIVCICFGPLACSRAAARRESRNKSFIVRLNNTKLFVFALPPSLLKGCS